MSRFRNRALALLCAFSCYAISAAAAATQSSPPAALDGTDIAVGSPAPDFALPDQDGRTVGPKDFAGHWLVLYFYPKDFTGGCTLEGRNFQKDSAKYAAADAAIVGVSMDSPGSHKDFCAKEGLRFRLLSDSGGAVSAKYGSLNSILGKKLSARNTFIIDPQGKVARIFVAVKPATHSAEVLAALAELRKTKAP